MVVYDLVWLLRLLVGVLLFRLLCADYGFDTASLVVGVLLFVLCAVLFGCWHLVV